MMSRKKIIVIALVTTLWAPVKPFFIPEKAARGIAIVLGTATAAWIGKSEVDGWKSSSFKWEGHNYISAVARIVSNTAGGSIAALTTLVPGAGVFILTDGYLANYTLEGSLAIAKLNVNALLGKLSENQLFSNEFTNENDLALFIDTFLGNKKSVLIDISKQIKGFLGTTKKILASTNKVINESADADMVAEAKELQSQAESIEQKIKTIGLLLEKTPQFKEILQTRIPSLVVNGKTA